MSVLTLREAVVTGLRASLPRLAGKTVKVEAHAGRFDAAELRRISAQAPAVFVAVLGLADLSESCGEVSATCQLLAIVVCKDAPGLPRDLAALGMMEALAKIVPGNGWNDAAEKAPEDIRCDNLFSATLDQAGVAMWGVAWRQRATVAKTGVTDPELEGLDWFLNYHMETELAKGAPVAVDDVTLPSGEE
jgi:hypothetical protein